MPEFDIVLLTEDRYEDPPVMTEYIRNILTDDHLLKTALENRGLRVIRKSWADPEFNWKSTRFACFRTTWDYFERFEKFSKWLEVASSQTTFINSIELIKWNMDKHYLSDLNNRDVHTVETLFMEKNDDRSLADISQKFKGEIFILKPAVSGTARHTYKITSDTLSAHEDIFKALIANESMLLQPFQQYVLLHGEISMIVIGGRFTHAVRKKAKDGDFRVQDDFGGTVHAYQPANEEIEFAEKAVNTCNPRPLYARVDIIRDNNNRLAIMELELIEPELWFRRNPLAAEMLADEILKLF